VIQQRPQAGFCSGQGLLGGSGSVGSDERNGEKGEEKPGVTGESNSHLRSNNMRLGELQNAMRYPVERSFTDKILVPLGVTDGTRKTRKRGRAWLKKAKDTSGEAI
jgi:hypothetical protein